MNTKLYDWIGRELNDYRDVLRSNKDLLLPGVVSQPRAYGCYGTIDVDFEDRSLVIQVSKRQLNNGVLVGPVSTRFIAVDAEKPDSRRLIKDMAEEVGAQHE